MPADYAKIRDENIARYGWDTAVLDLLGQLYSERTHFVYELIQNAEDAGATELAFALFPDRLEVRHDGRPFTEADVRGVCGVGKSAKAGDLTKIGKFGIGFKSVYAYTRTPRIHSSAEHFRIENYVRPAAIDPPDPAEPGDGTLFVFPFDHDSVPAAVAVAEIAAALNRFSPRSLLFLHNIGRVSVRGTRVRAVSIARSAGRRSPASRRVTLAKGRAREEWLIWHRALDGESGTGRPVGHPAQRAEIALQVSVGRGSPRVVPQDRSPLVVFFATEKETGLGFLIQGPYRTTPARDNVPEHDPWNQALVRQTSALLTEVLGELRADGLLTAEVLAALPLDAGRFPAGSMFRPLFDAGRAALSAGQLIPAAGGGYAAARDLVLAGDDGLRGLLTPEQLGAIYRAGRPLRFAAESITEHRTPLLWRYLRDEIGVPELTPEGLVKGATAEFLGAHSDDWISRLYQFLDQRPSLWRAFPGEPPGPARLAPILRLEDGSHIAPGASPEHPAAYLPGPVVAAVPTVRRAIAEVPAARHFLAALGLTEPDLIAEVLDSVLPRYDGLDLAGLDPAQHAADTELVVRALDEAAAGRRGQLVERARATAFLVGENAATGEQRLMLPASLYQRSKELEIYFAGNPEAWFAADSYGPWLTALRELGIRQDVQIRARAAGPLGYVLVAEEFARNERGLDGFDPEAEIDGLEFALRHPDQVRSEYAWNVLLAPNRHLVTGVIEKSVRLGFADATREQVSSPIGAVAAGEAWLPGPDGRFHRPAALSLDDLPAGYRRDEALAAALGMSQPVVAQASQQLGIPAAVLWGLSAHPDLIRLIEGELARRATAGPDGSGSRGNPDGGRSRGNPDGGGAWAASRLPGGNLSRSGAGIYGITGYPQGAGGPR